MQVRTASSILLSSLLAYPCGVLAGTTTAAQSGCIQSHFRPIAAATVTLYAAGDQPGSGATALGSAVTNISGTFTIHYNPPSKGSSVLYIIADGPSSSTRLAAILGLPPIPTKVIVNERTTVASAFAMAQFLNGPTLGGKSPGLQNAAGTFRNLVDLSSGDVAPILRTPPNGLETSAMRAFNSLANMLAACIRNGADCANLFTLTTPPNGPTPQDTLQAALNIAHFTWRNSSQLFAASQVYQPYRPALLIAPETWALAIKYIGNGHEFDGPGNTAFDAQGNAWITNNYIYQQDHSDPTCGGRIQPKLTPTGADAPGAPFDGQFAGVNGPGFGIAVDPSGNAWVSNFGFYGSTCPPDAQPPANSVSQFSPDGTPLSPPAGFTQGCISSPQGIVADPAGNIWIANSCGSTVTQYHLGNPDIFWVFDFATSTLAPNGVCPPFSGAKPFDIAIDAAGNAWISDNAGDRAVKLSSTGEFLAMAGSEAGIKTPLGVAIDSVGDVWISNPGVLNIPCPTAGQSPDYGDLKPDPALVSVTKLSSSGSFIGTFSGGGMTMPWGIAVDGNDNIWIANFAGQRVTQLNGATGQPIAPHGYHSDGLVRNTGIEVDSSGNVWVCNNWLLNPVPTNPGGDGMVVFIGLAAPVKTPLLGPPQQP